MSVCNVETRCDRAAHSHSRSRLCWLFNTGNLTQLTPLRFSAGRVRPVPAAWLLRFRECLACLVHLGPALSCPTPVGLCSGKQLSGQSLPAVHAGDAVLRLASCCAPGLALLHIVLGFCLTSYFDIHLGRAPEPLARSSTRLKGTKPPGQCQARALICDQDRNGVKVLDSGAHSEQSIQGSSQWLHRPVTLQR